MTTVQDFTGYKPTWCPGCGNHGILMAIRTALTQLNFDPSSVVAVFGIGCSGNMNDFLNSYAIHSLHGRAIPNAVGVKLANHKLKVVVIAGDGDIYGEGGNHLLHGCRGNHDITVIIHDNRVYGLTTGQTSPRAPKGFKSKSTPQGVIERSLNPIFLTLTSGATFVAQAFAGDLNNMISLVKAGIQHRGFSFINILQPCVTFNKVNTYQYYLKRAYKLPLEYQVTDFNAALEKAKEVDEEKFPLGVIYQVSQPTYTDMLLPLREKTLVAKERFVKFEELLREFV